MSYKISKELFEAVMNVGLYDELYIDNYFDEYNGVEIEDWQIIKYNNTWIPLDTFVFKCKKWAFRKGYELLSSPKFKGKKLDGLCQINLNSVVMNRFKKLVIAPSEQQAVFDACTYILNELSNK